MEIEDSYSHARASFFTSLIIYRYLQIGIQRTWYSKWFRQVWLWIIFKRYYVPDSSIIDNFKITIYDEAS
jgi:hypothetical protein